MNLYRALRPLPALLVVMVIGCAQLPDGKSGLDTTQLHNAIVADHVEYVKAAVQTGTVNVNQRIPASAYAEGTPLITIAARAGAVNVLRFLIASGADINARTPANETSLMLATYFYGSDRSGSSNGNHEKVVHILVEAGAQLENLAHNYTPLSYAAYQGHEKLISYLLKRGARVDADARGGTIYINTPLMMAAMQGHRGAVLLLLRAGANARVRVHQGHTAAELAEKHHGQHLVAFLRCAEKLSAREKFAQRCEGASAQRGAGTEALALGAASASH